MKEVLEILDGKGESYTFSLSNDGKPSLTIDDYCSHEIMNFQVFGENVVAEIQPLHNEFRYFRCALTPEIEKLLASASVTWAKY